MSVYVWDSPPHKRPHKPKPVLSSDDEEKQENNANNNHVIRLGTESNTRYKENIRVPKRNKIYPACKHEEKTKHDVRLMSTLYEKARTHAQRK